MIDLIHYIYWTENSELPELRIPDLLICVLVFLSAGEGHQGSQVETNRRDLINIEFSLNFCAMGI